MTPKGPKRTIRLRLTVWYGAVFLLTGAVLLTIGYLIVRHNLDARPDFQEELRHLGVAPGTFGASPGTGPGSPLRAVYAAAHRQLVADALHRLLIEYVAALVVMTALSVAAGWLLAGRALAPLRAITATARRVSGQNLGERIALEGPADELKELADTFDGMLERLDRAFASQRHFVANASHELRTPLAIMRTEVDVALADPGAGAEELRAMGEAVRETIDRSEGLIEALLVLARSEGVNIRKERVDLTELAAVCLTDLRGRAAARDIELRPDLQPGAVAGEPNLLERMIGNLLENGIRHNVPGGHLTVTTATEGTRAELTVSNGGPVIDPEQAAALAQPFRRLTRGSGGFGLGLSIVQSVVQAHHGELAIEAPPEGGLTVRISLPAFPALPAPGTDEPPRRARSLTAQS